MSLLLTHDYTAYAILFLVFSDLIMQFRKDSEEDFLQGKFLNLYRLNKYNYNKNIQKSG